MCTSCRGRWLILCRLVEPKHRTDGRLCQEIAGRSGGTVRAANCRNPTSFLHPASLRCLRAWDAQLCKGDTPHVFFPLTLPRTPCLDTSKEAKSRSCGSWLRRHQITQATTILVGLPCASWSCLPRVTVRLPPCGQILPCEVNNP